VQEDNRRTHYFSREVRCWMDRAMLIIAADSGPLPLDDLAKVARSLAAMLTSPRHGCCVPAIRKAEYGGTLASLAADGLLINPTLEDIATGVTLALETRPDHLIVGFVGHGAANNDDLLFYPGLADHDEATRRNGCYRVKQVLHENSDSYAIPAITLLLDLCEAEVLVEAVERLRHRLTGITVLAATSHEKSAYGLRFTRRLTSTCLFGLPQAGELLYLDDLRPFLRVTANEEQLGQHTRFVGADEPDHRSWLSRNPRFALSDRQRAFVDQHFPVLKGDAAEPLQMQLAWQRPAELQMVVDASRGNPVVVVCGAAGVGKSCIMAALLLGLAGEPDLQIDAAVEVDAGSTAEDVVREIWTQLRRRKELAVIERQSTLLRSAATEGRSQPFIDRLLEPIYRFTGSDQRDDAVTVVIDGVDQLPDSTRVELDTLLAVVAERSASHDSSLRFVVGARNAPSRPDIAILELKSPTADAVDSYLRGRGIAQSVRDPLVRITHQPGHESPTWLLFRIYGDAIVRHSNRTFSEGTLDEGFSLVLSDAADEIRSVLRPLLPDAQCDATLATILAVIAAGQDVGGVPRGLAKDVAPSLSLEWNPEAVNAILAHEALRPYLQADNMSDESGLKFFRAELAQFVDAAPEHHTAPWLPTGEMLRRAHDTIATRLIEANQAISADQSLARWFDPQNVVHVYGASAVAHHLVRAGRLAEAEERLLEWQPPFPLLAVAGWSRLYQDLARLVGPDDQATLRVGARHASLLRQIGHTSRARTELESLLARQSRVVGPEHGDTLVTKSKLGRLLYSIRDAEGATRTLREVLDVSLRVHGEHHRQTLITQGNLVAALRVGGDLAGAKTLAESTLETRLLHYPVDDVETLASRMSLVAVLRELGEYEEALGHAQIVLDTRLTSLGDRHPDTWNARLAMANIHRYALDFESSVHELEKVRSAQAEVLGDGADETLMTTVYLADTLHDAGRPGAAANYISSVMAARDRAPDAESSLGHRAAVDVGRLLRAAGRLREAIGHFSEVLRIRTETLGTDDPATLLVMVHLANALRADRQATEAVRILTDVVGTKRRVFGEDHPTTLDSRANLAHALRDDGRPEAAIEQMEMVLAGRASTLDKDHRQVLGAKLFLGETLRMTGQVNEAIDMLTDVLEAQTGRLGAEEWILAGARKSLARALRDSRSSDRTIHRMTMLADALTSSLGIESGAAQEATIRLALTLREAGQSDDAVARLVAVYEARRDRFGIDHPDTHEIAVVLASAMRDVDRKDEAVALLATVFDARSRLLGPRNSATLTARVTLAGALRDVDRLKEAIDHLVQVVDFRTILVGADNEETLNNSVMLAKTLLAAGRIPEAVARLTRVVSVRTTSLGAAASATLSARMTLAQALHHAGQLAAAISHIKAVVEIRTAMYGAHDYGTISARSALADSRLADIQRRRNMARLAFQADRGTVAQEILEAVLAEQLSHLSATDAGVWLTRLDLARVLRANGDNENSRRHLDAVSDSVQAALVEDQSEMVDLATSVGVTDDPTVDEAAWLSG
jgi:tetratricopeptide (TPR) repeat protein